MIAMKTVTFNLYGGFHQCLVPPLPDFFKIEQMLYFLVIVVFCDEESSAQHN